MKKKILVGLLLAGGTMFAAPRVSFDYGYGAPAPVVNAVPQYPGAGYVFEDGYWRYTGVRDSDDYGYFRDRDDHVRYDRDRDDDYRRGAERFDRDGDHFDRDGGHFDRDRR